jgi:hypothetical protein
MLALACTEKVDSVDVRTHGVYAEYEAVSNGTSTSVSARLKVGGDDSNTFLELQGQDELRATVGDQPVKELTGSDEVYRATFSEGGSGVEVVVSFMRGPDDEDAPDSSAILPDVFTIDDALAGQEVSREDDIVITWDPSGTNDDMEWELDGADTENNCIDWLTGSVSDGGMLVIPAEDFEPNFDSDEMESCEVTFTLDRIRAGSVDDAFGEGGRFLAIQRRRLSFIATPCAQKPG